MLHTITANFQAAPDGVRRDVFEGVEHLVVPVVMICEGVLNDALVPAAEFGKYPEAWNGRPVPVLHPQENGGYISANRPDVIERNTIGTIFNARVVDRKLKADAWINTEKAKRLGYGDLVQQLEAGEVVEVSTGYFADDDPKAGDYNGTGYSVIHRNIRPDHLALLPGEIGACSIADGCGTRVNSKKGSFAMKVNEAWSVISKSLGLNSNCQCEEDQSMDILKKAEEGMKANAITPAQFKMVQDMAPEDRTMLGAILQALGEVGGGEMDEVMEDDPSKEEEAPLMTQSDKGNAPKAMTEADIQKLIANGVAEGVKAEIRRIEVMGKLATNSANKLTEDQMKAMSVEQLEAVEQMIRPADYSGAGGFAANSDAIDTNVQAMPLRGVLGGKKKEA